MMEDRHISDRFLDRVADNRVGEPVAGPRAAETAEPAGQAQPRTAGEDVMAPAGGPVSRDAAPAPGGAPVDEPAAERQAPGPLDQPRAGAEDRAPVEETAAGAEDRMPVDGDVMAASARPAGTSPGPDAARMDPGPAGAHAEPVPPETIGSARNPSAGPWMKDQANLRNALQDIQATFVDDPDGSVRRAADLAESTVETLFERVRQQTHDLRASWDGREQSREPDTETLRNALRSYRVFIDHLTGV